MLHNRSLVNRLLVIALVLLAACGASTRAVAKVHVPEKLASGIFAPHYDSSAPVDEAGSLDFAGRNEAHDYELVSGQSKWLNRDPIADLGFNVTQIGRAFTSLKGDKAPYQFVDNDPINHIDKLGLVKVRLKYEAYIEGSSVTFFGRTFNAGMKIRHEVEMDTDQYTFRETGKYIGPTIEYDSDGNVIGRGQATGSTVKASLVGHGPSRGSGEHFFCITMSANEGNPLVGMAPGITYSVTICACKKSVTWSGSHDGFPSHDFYVDGERKHHYSHTTAGASPWSLFPPASNITFSGNKTY